MDRLSSIELPLIQGMRARQHQESCKNAEVFNEVLQLVTAIRIGIGVPKIMHPEVNDEGQTGQNQRYIAHSNADDQQQATANL